MQYQHVEESFTTVNRKYKDSVFRDLFGSPERIENALSLYNALNGTSYTDPGDLTLTTLNRTIYLGYKNDVSFLIGEEMVLWEQQSTPNPNMPLRGLLYFAELYSKHIEPRKRAIYSEQLLELPTPRYYVFYTGADDVPDSEVLRLSSAFTGGPGDVEVTVTVLNVREGRNSGIMEACEALAGYAHLVALVYDYARKMPIEEAVDRAVQQCIDEGVLAGYLRERRSEVTSWFLTDYTAEERLRYVGEAKRKEGSAEMLISNAASLRESMGLDLDGALKALGHTRDEYDEALRLTAQMQA